MVNNLKFNLDSINQLGAAVNRRYPTAAQNPPQSNAQQYPLMTGSIKYAPSRKFVHVLTETDDDGNKHTSYVNGVYMYIGNLPYIIRNYMARMAAIDSVTEAMWRQLISSDNGLTTALTMPHYTEDLDGERDIKTYLNKAAGGDKYDIGDEVRWDDLPDECTQRTLYVDWIELPVPAPQDFVDLGILPSYTVAVFSNIEDVLLYADDTALKFALVITDSLWAVSQYNAAIANSSDAWFRTPVIILRTSYDTSVDYDGAGPRRFQSGGMPLTPVYYYYPPTVDVVPLATLSNVLSESFNAQGEDTNITNAAVFFDTKRLSDAWLYKRFLATGSNKLDVIALLPETENRGMKAYGVLPAGSSFATAYLFQRDYIGLSAVTSLKAHFWAYRPNRPGAKTVAIVMFDFTGDVYVSDKTPPESALDGVFQLFGAPATGYSGVIPLTLGTYIQVSGPWSASYLEFQMFDAQWNRNIVEVAESMVAYLPVDSRGALGLSSVDLNRNGELEIYGFENLDYHYTAQNYVEQFPEIVIREKIDDYTARVNYVNLSALVYTDTEVTNGQWESIEWNNRINGLQLYDFQNAATITSADLASNLNGQFDIVLRQTTNNTKIAYSNLYEFTSYLENKIGVSELSATVQNIAQGAAKTDDEIDSIKITIDELVEKTDEEDGDFWIRGANSDKNYGMGIGDSSKNLCIKTDTLAGTNYQLINDWDVTGELNVKKTLTVGNSNDLIANPDLSDVELGAATTRFTGNVVRFETNSTVRFDSSTIYFENPPLFKTGLKEGVNELLYTSQNITLPNPDPAQQPYEITLLATDAGGMSLNGYFSALRDKITALENRIAALENPPNNSPAQSTDAVAVQSTTEGLETFRRVNSETVIPTETTIQAIDSKINALSAAIGGKR